MKGRGVLFPYLSTSTFVPARLARSPDEIAETPVLAGRTGLGGGGGASLEDGKDEVGGVRGDDDGGGETAVQERLVEGHVGGALRRLAGGLGGDAVVALEEDV